MNKHADKTQLLRNCYSKTSHSQGTDISPSIITRKVEWQEACCSVCSQQLLVCAQEEFTSNRTRELKLRLKLKSPNTHISCVECVRAAKLRALWSETHVLARPFRSNYTVNLVVRNKRWIHSSKCVIVKELRILRGYSLSQRCKLSLRIYELQRSADW
jgi:hypothetical protein